MSERIVPDLKPCAYCGQGFQVGGRGRPTRKQQFCSRRCQALGRMVTPKVKQLAQLDLAYLAGLIDGEGCILLFKQKERVRPTLRLAVGNTYRPVLEWAKEAVGAGSIITQPKQKLHHSQSWRWDIYSQNAVDVLRQLLPYLKLKREQALKAIESQQVRRSR